MNDNLYYKVDFAILSPMPEESISFIEKLKNEETKIVNVDQFKFKIIKYKDHKILQASIGIGTTFAASVVTLINKHFCPDYLFLLGTAGGISDNVNINDILIIDEAYEVEIQGLFEMVLDTPFASCLMHPLKKENFTSTYKADLELLHIISNIKLQNRIIQYGKAATSNTFPAPKELFQKIRRSNAKCIDMETSAVYQIAWLLNMKTLAIRGISNILDINGEDSNLNTVNILESMKGATELLFNLIDTLIAITQNKNKQKVHNL